jgi:hypothetical protein
MSATRKSLKILQQDNNPWSDFCDSYTGEMTWFRILVLAVLFWQAQRPASAFSLLGPYTSWMQTSNGYRFRGDIGGPMQIGSEYRWNLPVMTYGFDSSFVETFGAQGVAAVEAAIKMLNDLPPASALNLGLFPMATQRQNFHATEIGLLDLKSTALRLILEQLGLAAPSRNVWTLGYCQETNSCEVIQRNFSPTTLMPSDTVNGTAYTYSIWYSQISEAIEFQIDPFDFGFSAVMDWYPHPGYFYLGLTSDDVGGLRYLLNKANINIESLPLGVTRIGSSLPPAPNAARRPGVEKIRFMKMNWNSRKGRFNAITNVFTLKYLENRVTNRQVLQRTVKRPDLLFKAADIGGTPAVFDGVTNIFPHFFERTGTERWRNMSIKNRNASGEGPGVILPGAVITFGKPHLYDTTSFPWQPLPKLWGSFDGTTNAPILYGY